jgi:acyl carrier protein
MSRQEKIIEIVKRVSKSDVAPDPEESLFDSGYLDSFAAIRSARLGPA